MPTLSDFSLQHISSYLWVPFHRQRSSLTNPSYIHITGNFVYWHRMFIWTFEQTLRSECGYSGYLPYWNYAKTSEDLLGSPM